MMRTDAEIYMNERCIGTVQLVRFITPEIALTKCLECDGKADIRDVHPEPWLLNSNELKCNYCKGTGEMYVGI